MFPWLYFLIIRFILYLFIHEQGLGKTRTLWAFTRTEKERDHYWCGWGGDLRHPGLAAEVAVTTGKPEDSREQGGWCQSLAGILAGPGGSQRKRKWCQPEEWEEILQFLSSSSSLQLAPPISQPTRSQKVKAKREPAVHGVQPPWSVEQSGRQME